MKQSTFLTASTSPIQASLLDLPDLALEKIFSNLPPSDLASCMMCCSTLQTLLRPRQSALVRARSLGKKWVLRACGRALFADFSRRYLAGVAKIGVQGHAQDWQACAEMGRHVAQNGQRHFRMATIAKVTPNHLLSGFPTIIVHPACFYYLGMLAKSLGFLSVVERFRTVRERAMASVQKEEIDSFWVFLSSLGTTDFDLWPTESIDSDKIFPRASFSAVLRGRLGPHDYMKLRIGLCQAARSLFGAELMSTLHFTDFVQISYSWVVDGNFDMDAFTNFFHKVLDLGLPCNNWTAGACILSCNDSLIYLGH